jgi:hypothetical protein
VAQEVQHQAVELVHLLDLGPQAALREQVHARVLHLARGDDGIRGAEIAVVDADLTCLHVLTGRRRVEDLHRTAILDGGEP